jgi:hypothetical protein
MTMQASADSLSSTSRQLTRLVAALFALLGLVLFVAPAWSATTFLWKISPFVAMTMGGWYLGSAIVAWEAARVWQWSVVYARLLYLWAFALLESVVLLLHTDKLQLNTVLGWPYLLMLVVASIAALVGIYEWARLRPSLVDSGGPIPGFLRVLILIFAGFVAFLAVMGGLGFGQGAQVFPEKLSLFTIHGFAAFYLSLGVGALSLLWSGSMAPVIAYSQTGLALIVSITVAALVNLDKFDFAGRPGGMVYIGIYLVVGAAVGILLWSRRERKGLGYVAEM